MSGGNLKVWDGILEWLAGGQATAEALAEATGREMRDVKFALAVMLTKGVVTKHDVASPKGSLTVYRTKNI